MNQKIIWKSLFICYSSFSLLLSSRSLCRSFVPKSKLCFHKPLSFDRSFHTVRMSETDTSLSETTSKPFGFVDVHAHLIHEDFLNEEDEIAIKCANVGLEFIVVNGLEPISNRKILDYSMKHNNILPSMGIYPIDAMTNVINRETWPHPFPPPEIFDVDAEIEFIDQMATDKKIVALGECGLDRYYLNTTETNLEQERVLRLLMRVAKKHDLPIILHTRKAEERVLEMLIEEGVKKADFHCFCGKAKLGAKIAAAGYYLSIPTAVERVDSFQKLVSVLPIDKILTETDCPYMGPDKGGCFKIILDFVILS